MPLDDGMSDRLFSDRDDDSEEAGYAGSGEDAPAPTGVGGEGDDGVFRTIGESEEWQCLERTVELHGA